MNFNKSKLIIPTLFFVFGSSSLFAEFDQNLMPEITHSSNQLGTYSTPQDSEFSEESKISFQKKVKKVQIKLKEKGYEISKVDGQLEKETRQALVEFQRDQELKPTGYPNQRTLNALSI